MGYLSTAVVIVELPLSFWSPIRSTLREKPTITIEMMSRRARVEKSSDADLLREMVGFAA